MSGRKRMMIDLDNIESMPGKALTSPRSLQACQDLFIDPESLTVRDLDYFLDQAKKPISNMALQKQIAEYKLNHHNEKRREELAQCRQRRNTFIEQQANSKFALRAAAAEEGGRTPKAVKLSPVSNSSSSSPPKPKLSQLEILKKRQQREMEMLLGFELEMAKVREEHHRKLDKEARLKKAKDKADMKRRKERLEEERQMVLEKKRKAEEEAEMMRQRSQEEARQERAEKRKRDIKYREEQLALRKRHQEEVERHIRKEKQKK